MSIFEEYGPFIYGIYANIFAEKCFATHIFSAKISVN